jgi:hypothetical protein
VRLHLGVGKIRTNWRRNMLNANELYEGTGVEQQNACFAQVAEPQALVNAS